MSSKKLQNDGERRSKLMEIFHQYKEFYMLKEIEKLAKEKGVEQKYVKVNLQALIDEGKIESDKIGSTIYYWSFPVNVKQIKRKSSNLKSKNKILNEKLNILNEAFNKKLNEEKLQAEKDNNQDDDAKERKIKCTKLKAEIATLKIKEQDLLKVLSETSTKTSINVEKIKKDAEELHAAANRWTDAVFVIRSYLLKNCNNVDEKAVNKEFLIPDNFDYV
ncbi:hypothetical protein PVAND_005628 [Polypedilum vanderplanki]|uniref:Meiotic nuclear division protein 1 homolog n=1 Tax=Polypedilum vanderplanki TaxID=319348 RepID=A0A9J6C2M2_POLVA|nr:hypothetical protein PVAND_005628 [Polypedilum vanderplanki]